MSTLMVPESGRKVSSTGEEGIRFQGDAGWGVMSESRYQRQEKARQNRAGLFAAHGRGIDQ